MNSKLRIFVFCICLAALFWLLNHLNRIFTVDVIFHIDYQDVPFSNNSKKTNHLQGEISGDGFALLRYYFSHPQTIYLQESDFKSNKEGDSVFYKIIPEKINNKINENLSHGIRLQVSHNEHISFAFPSTTSKEVPIGIKINNSKLNKCEICGVISCSPNTVKIVGPESIVKTIDTVFTKNIEYTKCDTFINKISLAIPHKEKLKSNVNEVRVFIPYCNTERLEIAIPYSIEHSGHSYFGNTKVNLIVPESTNEKNTHLSVYGEVIDQQIALKIKNPNNYKIISVHPKFIHILK